MFYLGSLDLVEQSSGTSPLGPHPLHCGSAPLSCPHPRNGVFFLLFLLLLEVSSLGNLNSPLSLLPSYWLLASLFTNQS